ncbi:general transcription factor 3C polypeptide 4 isoform X3 [Macrobrachium rosenbergii]|uniref:general transcription factor 3C polypeptide 4 isoform X3 n=1 Tax=Macrobrachium rosenbergii TaxID=79674 RepID=UPI0034D6500D
MHTINQKPLLSPFIHHFTKMLEKIEVRQLVQGIPIAITVLVGSPMSWSEDQQIAVVTQLGAYIFELSMSPEDGAPGVMFSRFFVPPPAQPNPYLETDHVDRSAAHSLMLDGYITAGERAWNELDPRMIRNTSPAMPGGDPSHRGYWKGSWSPYGVGVNGRCLLALVTYDHRVIIMGREGHKWVTVVDISALWYKEVAKDSWKMVALPHGAPVHEIHTARMRMLGVSEIQWAPIVSEGKKRFCMLMMVTISGHVVFWKIPVELINAAEVHLSKIEETKMKITSAIHWLSNENKSGYLVLGGNNGQVKIFYVEFAEELVFRDLGYAFDSDDRVRVNHLHMIYLEDMLYMLLLAKQSILVAVTLNLCDSALTARNVSHCHLGRLPISGMICLQNRNVFLSMKDGYIRHAYLDYDNGVTKIELKDTPFKSDGVSYTGLSASPNGTLWAILESVSVAYDHLVVREPSQISIYQIGSGDKIFQYLQKSRVPLHFEADLLESLRLYYCKTGEASLQLMTPEEIDSHTEGQVKLHYWLVRMCRSIRVSDDNSIYPMDAIEAAIGRHIIEVWIITTIKRFITEDWSSKPSLSLSLSLMCQWITANGKEKDKTFAQKLAKKLTGDMNEHCPICMENIPLKLLTSGTCENGHTLPRCCRTLLVTKPIVMCSRCKSFTHNIAGGMYFLTFLEGSLYFRALSIFLIKI